MNNHVPDGKTQVKLAIIRWRANTADILRRSLNTQSYDYEEQTLEQARQRLINTMFPTAGERIGAAHQKSMELLMESQAIRSTLNELADTWAAGSANSEQVAQQHKDSFGSRREGLISQYRADMSYNATLKNWAPDFTNRKENHVENLDCSLYVRPLEEGMTKKEEKHVKYQAFISLNNCHSLLIESAIRLEAAKETLNLAMEHWAGHAKVPMADVEAFVEAILERKRINLAENEDHIGKNNDYILNMIQHRESERATMVSHQHPTKKPGPR